MLPQLFNLEALLAPNRTVAGVQLSVRPPGFENDRRLPPHLKAAAAVRTLVTPGTPKCMGTSALRSGINAALSAAPQPSRAQAAALLAASEATEACVDDEAASLPPPPPSAAAVAAAAQEVVRPPGVGAVVQQQPSRQLPSQRALLMTSALQGEALAALLAPYGSEPWLHFTNVTAAFSGFASQSSSEEFERLASAVAWEWCCRSAARVKAGTPDGHVHQLRPWGSPRRFCARRMDKPDPRVLTYFC